MNLLERYGANERFFAEATLYTDMDMARVTSQFKGLYKIVTEKGERLAEVSGKFRHETADISDYPAVGDFVMISRLDADSEHAIIQKILTRKSMIERSAVGMEQQMQVIAANIDIVFICMSLNNDYNLSRIERYVSVAWNSRAVPVVVLTKSDLCADIDSTLLEISKVAIGVDIVTTSKCDNSYDKLLPYLKHGVTASFIGSSGVGKSTLINNLAGEEIIQTSGIRQDDKGRHTTTRRELFILPNGGIVIDTPGMRELGAASSNLSKSFSDIGSLTELCRFKDCTHTNEPGCAVLEAIEKGELDKRRFENYIKLKKEAKYEGLSARQIENEKINSMFGGINAMKSFKEAVKQKNRRRI